MKLYYCKGTCSLAIRILMHEIGITSEYEAVDLKTKKTETGADYLTINSKGSVPAIQLDNGEILTENVVIQQYLVDTYQGTQFLPAISEGLQHYRALEWLNYITTELHKNCSAFFNPNIPSELKNTLFKPMLIAKLQRVDQHLTKHTYLLGNQYSSADIYLFVILSWLPHLGFELSEFAQLSRLATDIKNRKAVQQALQEEGLK